MRTIIRFFLVIFMLVMIFPFVLGVETSDYQYFSDMKVHCSEYKGYVRFELPEQYFLFDTPSSYMEEDHYIDNNLGGSSYSKNLNWFVKLIPGQSVKDVEMIYDNNYDSYLVSENRDPIEFTFENPNFQNIDKISIDLKDSSINSIQIYQNGRELEFTENINNFHYEFLFNNPIRSNSLQFVIGYEDVIKIKEVSFFEDKSYDDKSFVYFYVDNNCNDSFRLYFGEYGENTARSGSKVLPVEFSQIINTYESAEYVDDFDGDFVSNDIDNCIRVSNEYQKDINYNGVGDACEDDDGDGVINDLDNCPDEYNKDQFDGDKDGIGNVCDDSDGRYFEQNKHLIYIMAGIIAVIFVIFSVILMKRRSY